uniref:Uncharacterized protein n=1 Tax=Macrostomum lignano TaxID=282301 RepID=A0A1I8GPN6_9PLAT
MSASAAHIQHFSLELDSEAAVCCPRPQSLPLPAGQSVVAATSKGPDPSATAA